MKLNEHVYYRKMYFAFVTPDGSRPIAVYTELLTGKKNILIDCGVSYNLPDVEMLCKEAGITLKDISLVIHTHCHADHTGLGAILKEKNPNIVFAGHPICKEWLADPEVQFSIRPVPCFHYLMSGPINVERVLQDGEILTDTGYPVQILYTPGHSADSISVYLPEEQTLIAGDAIINLKEMPFYENVTDNYETLKKFSALPLRHILSAFDGHWDVEKDGDMLKIAKARQDLIQNEIAAALREDPKMPLSEVGKRVLKELHIDMAPSPLFLKGIESGIRYEQEKKK